LDALVQFRDAYSSYVDVLEMHPAGYRVYHLVPKEGMESEAAVLRAEVARLSGAAAVVADRVAGPLEVVPPPMVGGVVKRMNPIRNWNVPLEPPNDLDTHHVLDYCNQAIGIIDAQLAQAKEEERSLAGRIARFVRLPYEVRRLASPSTRAGRAAALGAGVVLQGITVTVIGGLIVAGLIALFQRTL
jgi:hypothetical protein